MTRKEKLLRELSVALSYILVAALTAVITMCLMTGTGGLPASKGDSKLDQLKALLEECYIDIDKVDMTLVEDWAAGAMVDAIGDQWSYYIPAEDFDSYEDQMAGSYVGIGITISVRDDNIGFTIEKVEPGGSAVEAGILPGDILVEVEGQSVAELGMNQSKNLIQGEVGTTVNVTVLRDGQRKDFTLTRKKIVTPMAKAQMLPGDIGLVTITIFGNRCASETIAAIDSLVSQGAKSLIFDLRNNPGGYKSELVKVLDYLLPERVLFRSEDYFGNKVVDTSDAKCLQMPMAVIVNGNSYSAAEFFAAALQEHGWADIIGEPTTGKGKFQYTYQFPDGSGVVLSTGKYYTPNGVSLADQGGLVPLVQEAVSPELASRIYAGLVAPADDPQIQAAVDHLNRDK